MSDERETAAAAERHTIESLARRVLRLERLVTLHGEAFRKIEGLSVHSLELIHELQGSLEARQ